VGATYLYYNLPLLKAIVGLLFSPDEREKKVNVDEAINPYTLLPQAIDEFSSFTLFVYS
jgi:hypothetical protein